MKVYSDNYEKELFSSNSFTEAIYEVLLPLVSFLKVIKLEISRLSSNVVLIVEMYIDGYRGKVSYILSDISVQRIPI